MFSFIFSGTLYQNLHPVPTKTLVQIVYTRIHSHNVLPTGSNITLLVHLQLTSRGFNESDLGEIVSNQTMGYVG